MHNTADLMTEAGFKATDRRVAKEVGKVLGYAPTARPAGLTIPSDRLAATHEALTHLASRPTVDVYHLRSMLGVWIWEALLQGGLLAVLYSVFKFVQLFEGQRVPWWKIVRNEVRAMGDLVMFIHYDVGAPLAPLLFTTDAMGASAADCGGYAVVGASVPTDLLHRCFQAGTHPKLTISKLMGDFDRLLGRDSPLTATVPLSTLPTEVLDQPITDWVVPAQGRSRYEDRIELGEARATLCLLQLLLTFPSAHRRKIITLEDNSAWGGAASKGRSPSAALSYLCRRKVAITLAGHFIVSLPWVQSAAMPADEASRKIQRTSGLHIPIH